MADTLSHHANLLFARNIHESNLENQILRAENYDKGYQILKEKTAKNEQNELKTYLSLNKQGLLLHKNMFYIPTIA